MFQYCGYVRFCNSLGRLGDSSLYGFDASCFARCVTSEKSKAEALAAATKANTAAINDHVLRNALPWRRIVFFILVPDGAALHAQSLAAGARQPPAPPSIARATAGPQLPGAYSCTGISALRTGSTTRQA